MAERLGPSRQSIRRVMLGDMRHLIQIKVRDISPPTGISADFDEVFTTTNTVYAHIKTVRGEQIFDGTNTAVGEITHIFTIRAISGLTDEKWIAYKGNLYDIKDIESFDERGIFMQLKCSLRGDQNNPSNWA